MTELSAERFRANNTIPHSSVGQLSVTSTLLRYNVYDRENVMNDTTRMTRVNVGIKKCIYINIARAWSETCNATENQDDTLSGFLAV